MPPAAAMLSHFWKTLTRHVLAPRADQARVEAELSTARARTPRPVLWLVGKAQSGKSSIVAGLTGASDIEIGLGYRPCTRHARTYDFPADAPLVRFLDTRGLGEAGYDPAEDLAFARSSPGGILAVVAATDPAQQAVIEVLREARAVAASRPILLVQTCLHAGYPPATPHPQPWCFDREPLPEAVPRDLARQLVAQRQACAGLFDRHVAIDFTAAGDGFEPRLYGLEPLWRAIDELLPAGYGDVLRSRPDLMGGVRDAFHAAAEPQIVSYALLAGAAAAVPAPLWNLGGVFAAQATMLRAIASIYGQPLSVRVMGELGAAIGAGFLVRVAARSVLAVVPVAGTAAAAVLTAAATYGLGCTLRWYYAEVRQGAVPDAAVLRRVYREEFDRGRKRFEAYLSGVAADTVPARRDETAI
jgi:uncharacterized protein (DUF697 family)